MPLETMNVLPLAGEFPPVSREHWLAKVRRVLGRADFEDLRSVSDDGIQIEPLYEPGPGTQRLERSAADGRWIVTQRIDHPVPAEANELALEDLRSGATGLALTFNGAASARGFGLGGDDARSIAGALRNCEMHALSMRLEPGLRAKSTSNAIREVCTARSLNPEAVRLSFGIDPIGCLATHGGAAVPWKDAGPEAGRLAAELAADFRGPFLEADGRPYHDGGATEAQELGIVMATALAYLRALEDRISAEVLPRAVGVTLAVDCDLFMGIAKLRAMRLLWRSLLEASSMPAVPLALHAESSWRMMTRQAANLNVLRGVAAAFAAGLGGADSIVILPHSLILGLPDRSARRLARNVNNLLLDEAHLHQVGDPASGAGYVETMTQSLASEAWSIFQGIEKRGGMAPALGGGHVHAMVRNSADKRAERISLGQRPIIGVTEFPDPRDTAPAMLHVASPPPRASGAGAIAARRLSEPFEARLAGTAIP